MGIGTLGENGSEILNNTEGLDISNITIGEESLDNYGLSDFQKIVVLKKDGDTATISIDDSIFTVFWDTTLNQPKVFSIENNGKNTALISGPSNQEGKIRVISKDLLSFSIEKTENPLIIVDDSVYIICSEEKGLNEDEKGYLAVNIDSFNINHTMLYGLKNLNGEMEFKDIHDDSVLLGYGYYVNSDDIYNLNSHDPVTQLPFNGGYITDINHNDGNSFFGKHKDKTIKFCFFPLANPSIPHIDLFGETLFTDKDGYILEGNLEGYKIENPEGYKIDDDFIVIGLTNRKGEVSYINSDVLKKTLTTQTFDLKNKSYRFNKQGNLILSDDFGRNSQMPFSCINDPGSRYDGYPILEERLYYVDGRYNTGFSGENGTDYAFVLTKNGDKKLLAIRGGKVLEINENRRIENPTDHSKNLKEGVRVVGLHSNVGLVILSDSNNTSNYRYYALREDRSLIYIGGKDNICGNISKGELEFQYKILQDETFTSKIMFGSNGLPLVEFSENKTFIVCENNGKKVIFVLKVVNNYRQLTPETSIIIPEEEKDIEQYFKDYIENKVELIPGTEYLYTPGRNFSVKDISGGFQFIGLDGEVSKAEKIEDLPKIEIGGKSYNILCDNNGFHSEKYFLYETNGKQIIEIESLSSVYIRTYSHSSISYKYADTTGLKKTNCGAYIYPKVNDLLPENIRLALLDNNGTVENQYVVYDEEKNEIIRKIPTSQAPIKTSNPNEFIIISDDFDKYHTYDIQTGEMREKLIPEGLKLKTDDLSESYVIGWTGVEILMKDGKTKKVNLDGKDYYETKESGEFLGKKIVHLYDSKQKVLLPFSDNNGILSPVFEDIAGNVASILIRDGVLEYRFSYQSDGTKIPLNKIISTGGGEYIQFVNSNRGNEEKDKIVSIGNSSLRIGKSLNDYFSDIDSNYKAYLIEENEGGLRTSELPQIEVKTCSLEYTRLVINGIEIDLNFDYMGSFNTDNTQSLGILENYLKKILGSLVKGQPENACGKIVNSTIKTVDGLMETKQ